jgi:hypothetical protein
VEDPLVNVSNNPVFGIELGQFKTGENINYWIVAFNTANNSEMSLGKYFFVN